MQGKNHVALALAAPLGATLLTGRADLLPDTWPCWAALVVGSLMPDIDGEGAIARWGNWLPRYVTPRLVRWALNKLGETVSGIIRGIFGHRGTIHWPIIGAGIIAAGWYFSLPSWVIWLGIGYLLHIFGDSLTKSGVPLLGPLWTGDISFTPMVTGKWAESLFGVLLWCFVGWRMAIYSIPLLYALR